tara:strand:- start:827 stop:1735 length:909 start_codon:yes stop_codon:yes gene_type:complete
MNAKLFVFALLFCSTPVFANHVVGTVIDGRVLQADGFWHVNNVRYRLVNKRVCRRGKYCLQREWVKVAAVPLTYKSPDWRQQLLKIAEEREEHKEFMEAVETLGLGQESPQYAAQGYTPNAAQGNTVYGYSLNTITDVYGKNQVDVWMQQYARGQQAAQVSADKGLEGMLQAIKEEGSNRTRVAEIMAKVELLKSVDTPHVHQETTLKVNGTTPAQSAKSLNDLIATKCASCHSPAATKGVQGKSNLFPTGVDLSDYTNLSESQKRRCIEVVLSGEMPKNGTPLNVDEVGLFYKESFKEKSQ